MTRKDIQCIAYTFAKEHGLKGFSQKNSQLVITGLKGF